MKMVNAEHVSDDTADEVDGDFFDDELSEGDIGIPAVTEPFDPRKIDITPENQNVQYLVDLLEDSHIDLSTEFQRSPDLWRAEKMSRLIESLIIRLPIPPFYFAAERLPPTSEHPLQVVDGLQRLSALKRFAVDRTLKLEGLSFLRDNEGKRFDQLDRPSQRALLRAQVTIYIIRPGTPKKVTYVLFERLNTGGLTLNPQEIRHALNQGIPAQYLKDLVELASFRSLVTFNDGRMKNRELALRYVAFRMTPPEKYQRPLKNFLDDAMEKLATTTDAQRATWKRDLDQALSLTPQLLGDRAFRRRQFNKALFETWSCCLAEIDERQKKRLMKHAASLLSEYRKVLDDDTSRLTKAVTIRTSDEDAVKTRFDEIRKLIRDILGQP
jgi:hypothetical protein